VVVVVGAGVAPTARQESSGGPASRQSSQVSTDFVVVVVVASTDFVHGVTAQQVQQHFPVVAAT